MITVSVLYPNEDRSRFNMSYYLGSHIPLVQRLLGSALKAVVVEEGLGGPAPGTKPPYRTLCHLRFDSLETFQAAFGPHAAVIMKDIDNYSSVAPVIQISDVKLA
jgi:uncharacterized protein (TIGR02118 family)